MLYSARLMWQWLYANSCYSGFTARGWQAQLKAVLRQRSSHVSILSIRFCYSWNLLCSDIVCVLLFWLESSPGGSLRTRCGSPNLWQREVQLERGVRRFLVCPGSLRLAAQKETCAQGTVFYDWLINNNPKKHQTQFKSPRGKGSWEIRTLKNTWGIVFQMLTTKISANWKY